MGGVGSMERNVEKTPLSSLPSLSSLSLSQQITFLTEQYWELGEDFHRNLFLKTELVE